MEHNKDPFYEEILRDRPSTADRQHEAERLGHLAEVAVYAHYGQLDQQHHDEQRGQPGVGELARVEVDHSAQGGAPRTSETEVPPMPVTFESKAKATAAA